MKNLIEWINLSDSQFKDLKNRCAKMVVAICQLRGTNSSIYERRKRIDIINDAYDIQRVADITPKDIKRYFEEIRKVYLSYFAENNISNRYNY